MTDGLLLIHAFPVDSRMWRGQLGFGVATVAPDLPGFGAAERSGDVLTMATAAAACMRAIDAAGLDRIAVCGLSMGGYVAFELWRTVPDRILALVLANTRAEPDSAEGAAGRLALADRLTEEGNVLVDAPPPLLSDGATDGLRAEVRGWIADQPAAAIAAAARGLAARPDSVPTLATIDVPTLVVTSEADALIPASVTSGIAQKVEGADLVVIGDAGHLSNLEQPSAFNDALVAHLGRCGLGS